jgi:hypothetical protein
MISRRWFYMDGDTGADLECGDCADSIVRPRRLDAQGQLAVYLLSLKALCETGKDMPYPADLDIGYCARKQAAPS